MCSGGGQDSEEGSRVWPGAARHQAMGQSPWGRRGGAAGAPDHDQLQGGVVDCHFCHRSSVKKMIRILHCGVIWAKVSSYIGILLIYPPVLFSFVKTFIFGGNTASQLTSLIHYPPALKYTHYTGQRAHCSVISQ